ncbi:MAG: hypothetical protein HQM11_17040 [SAR324 cluster bacterium]|nr:hypothetical protein [SAR324 cluster bacterium]
MEWDKLQLIMFFQQHEGHRIMLEEKNSRFKISGICGEVNEMDLCSHDLQECALTLSLPEVDIQFTFHEQFMGIHILLENPETGMAELSLPLRWEYASLTVSLLS